MLRAPSHKNPAGPIEEVTSWGDKYGEWYLQKL